MSSPSPDPSSIVGRPVVASIGEPWDFRSAAGDNLLTARVVATSEPGAPVEWLLCEVSPFADGTHTITMVAAVRRHAGEEPLQRLLAHGATHANLLYDPSGAPLTPDRIRAVLTASAPTGVAFLVGSLRLLDEVGTPTLA